MANEMPKKEDLVREREALKTRVEDIRAEKNRQVAEKIKTMDAGYEETKNLHDLLKEAQNNLNYYTQLNSAGQLPDDERENYAKAQELVNDIKAKIEEYHQSAQKIMADPEVKDKVMEGAGQMDQRHNEEKEKQLKIKMLGEKFLHWIEKLNEIAEEISSKVEAEYAAQRKARENLIKKVEEVIKADSVKEELKQNLNYPEEFKQKALRYKRTLGFTKFTEKGGVDSLVNSDELREMEESLKHFERFVEENNLKGWSIRNFKECSWAILRNNIGGVGDEIKKLYEQAEESPYIDLRSVMDSVYKERGYSEDKNLSVESIHTSYRRY